MAPSCPGKAALPFSTQWPPPLSRTGRQRARTGPMRGEASPPAAGGGQRGKPRSSGPGPGPRPPALHGPGGHTFTSLPVLSPHRACVGPELLSKRCILTKSRRLGVASQRGFLAVPRPPSSGEWQVGGRSLVQGHPPVGCRPRGEGMSVGVSAGHDGAVKGGPQRSAWPVLPRRPRIVICVWVSLGTG